MDFGDLLEQWERLSARPGGLDAAEERERLARAEDARRRENAKKRKDEGGAGSARHSLESWLDEHGVEDKDAKLSSEEQSREAELRRLRDLRPEAKIDLHGLGAAEAETRLGLFLESAARAGLEKVLVVTGKGNHSKDGPVLGKLARSVVESSPWAGRFGTAAPSEGGRGALWVILRRRPENRPGCD